MPVRGRIALRSWAGPMRRGGFFRRRWIVSVIRSLSRWHWPTLRPARERWPVRDYGSGRREPPLVYFSRDVTPFMATRGQNYQNLLPRGGLWTDLSEEEIASCLVVPVISLPWQRFSSLSVLLSVTHEVGHVIVSDLDLLSALSDRLAGAKLAPERCPLWSGWLEEVFADIFSAVVRGSTVALALADQLGTQPEQPGSSTYPPGSSAPWLTASRCGLPTRPGASAWRRNGRLDVPFLREWRISEVS